MSRLVSPRAALRLTITCSKSEADTSAEKEKRLPLFVVWPSNALTISATVLPLKSIDLARLSTEASKSFTT